MVHPKPIIVLSDLHLGREDMVLAASELQPLIDAASTLIINGDAAELHVASFAQRARAELNAFIERCHASGTTLLRLAGNHDPQDINERYIVDRANGILITHGDVIDDAVAPWSDAAHVMRRRHREFLQSLPSEQRSSIDAQFWACREASISEWNELGGSGPPSTLFATLSRPRKLYNVLRFWRTQIPRMHAFATTHAPEATLVLIGHSHRPRIKRFGGRLFVNTGCFGFPGRPLAGVFDHDGFRVVEVSKTNGAWHLGRTLVHDASILLDEAALHRADIGPSTARAEATAAASTPVVHPASSA